MTETLTLYTVYLVQMAGTLFLAGLLARFCRAYGHSYLGEWARSFLTLFVYVTGGLLAFTWTRAYDPQHPIRLSVTIVTLVAGYTQIVFLLFGTYAAARGRPVAERARNPILGGCIVLAAVLALLFTAEPAQIAERYFTRIGLRSGAAGAAYLVAGIWLARDGGWRRGSGRSIVIGSFLLYGTEQLNYFVINTLEFLGVHQFGQEVILLGFVDFVLQFAMGLGMVIWLLEDEGDEVRRTAAALRRSEERARRSQRLGSVGQLAGGLAHDFNNLLTVITGRGQRLLDRFDEGSEGWQDARHIDEAADRGAVMVKQLLAFSRKQVLAPQHVQANEVVHNVRGMLQRSIGEEIEFVCELAPDLEWTLVDPAQLEQVLVNLVLNARDAMPEGGVLTVSTSNVEVEWSDSDSLIGPAPGKHIELAVSDTGMGMDDDTRRHVFEPFYTTKDVGKGSGLGMATAYGIVRQSGGSIVIDSELGAGTTVRVCLPRVRPPAEAPHEAAGTRSDAASITPPEGAPQATILVVEDDPRIRELLTAVLQDNGYDVIVAEDGGAALGLVESNGATIDLLLTDIVMPEIGGPELADRLVAIHPDVRVVFMSGYSEEIVSSRLLTQERILLEKPFSLPDLLACVNATLQT
jgi:signal transduction histidine kinase